ncbi:orotidine-5'-phosphate decarboxylase [Nesterenkonia ebinurensis]|uniref:orotidine-5'-phosphate decarboxylase n=1 Tax=Nesterenkonia ebinurensis TaxID=2608252 RepID=UPI00123CA300|nr:orotidine-5'-phosphate decarboxylase [Nesterenkonia ebinurensis]
MTTPPRPPFGARLAEALDRYGHLCVGIDPHPEILRDWGLPENGAGLKEFGERIIEAAAGRVGVVKPQVAFFENYGAAGMQALAEIITSARSAGLLVLGDAKRGDIDSTMAAYAEAWLNPEKDFAVDALTVSPYLGFGSLSPAVQAAHRYGAGLFVLALTSNPEGQQVQLAQGHSRTEVGQSTVAGQIVEQAASSNVVYADQPLGSIGLVVGATTAHLAGQHGIDLTAGRPPLLAPGYGVQGAIAQQLRTGFGSAWPQVLVSSSRGILAAGPQQADLVSAIESSRADLG